MGLTIHYSMKTRLTVAKDVRTLVSSLRRVARRLPFAKVGKLVEYRGRDAVCNDENRDSTDWWLKSLAASSVKIGKVHYEVPASHIIAFRVHPGEGCETAEFGFYRHPRTIRVTTKAGRVRQVATRLGGWLWHSFCKTEYASNPAYGGIEHFIRCHVGLCQLLDAAQATGLIEVKVTDESNYFANRDLAELVRSVSQWNQIIAGFAGMVKDAAERDGQVVTSPITSFPNFEHLEVQGLARVGRRSE